MFRRPRDYAEKRRRIDRFGKKTSVCDDFFHFSPILEKAGGKVTGKAAILAEGDAAKRKDIIYLESFPTFPVGKSR